MLVQPEHPQRLRADLVVLGLTAGWGLTFAAVKGALDSASTGAFLVTRFAIGAGLVLLALRGRALHRAGLEAGAISGVFVFFGFILQTSGLRYTTPTRSAFLTGLSVVLVPILRSVAFKKPVHVSAYVAAALAGFGLYWMSAAGLAAGHDTLLGDLLTVGCAVAFAVSVLFTERLSQKVPSGAFAFGQLATVGLGAALTLPFETWKFEPTRDLVVGLLYCGVFASAIAFSLQSWALKRTTAVRAALIYSLEPIFTATFAWLMGDHILRATLEGGALIVVAIVTADVWPRLERRAAAPVAAAASLEAPKSPAPNRAA